MDLLDFHPDPAAASPLYVQLAQACKQAIQDGRFKADEALPSGACWPSSSTFRASPRARRLTASSSKGSSTASGSGNYIAPLEQPLSRLSSFSGGAAPARLCAQLALAGARLCVGGAG